MAKSWRGRRLAATAAAAALAAAAQARAGEVLGGVYAHALGEAQRESGADVMAAYRTDRIDALRLIWRPELHVLGSVNTDVDTDFVAVGLSWPIPLGHRFYLQPGIGFAYTTGKAGLPAVNAPGLSPQEIQRRLKLHDTRIDFGSHWLFEPELALGYRINERWAVEASYVHLSTGQITHSGKNEGLDDLGLRLAYRFGGR